MGIATWIRRPAWLVAALTAVVLAVAAAGWLLVGPGSAYEVRGEAAVPYNAGSVKEVRVLDSVTLYVDGEPKPGPSVIGGIALIVLGTAAFMTALVLWIAGARRRLRTFYLIAAAGLAYAGADELFAIHESIGHNFRFLADVPGVSRPDDLIIALYLLPALVFAYAFRDLLMSDRRAATAMAIGLAFFALSSAADLASLRVEEYLELLAGICIAIGISALMYSHLRRNLVIHVEAVDPRSALEAVERRPTQRAPAGAAR